MGALLRWDWTAAVTESDAFHRYVVDLQGRELIVVGKPGVWSWDAVNPGTAALLEIPRFEPRQRILDLGCGTGVIGAAAAALVPSAQVTMVDSNVVAVSCARRTLQANQIENAEVRLSDGAEGLDHASFDLVLSHLPRGREVQHQLIRSAARVLRPKGRFIFVASTRVGVKGCVAYARELFGRCGVVRRKKAYHVAMTLRPEGMEPPPARDLYQRRPIVLDGADVTLISKPGVFAWDRLDGGTERLVAAMEIGVQERVLDLGCGTGLAGLAAARRAQRGEVVLLDSDLRAVRSARRTLEANGVAHGEVILSDGVSEVLGGAPFDVVITNPPFHQGREVDYEVAWSFIRGAHQVLRPGGRIFLVANRFIGYDDLMGETFGDTGVAYADSSYHVLTATT